MASLFSARRKPKRVVREEPFQADQDADDSGSAVRRPGTVTNKSKLRVSFNPADDDVEDSSNVQSENELHMVKQANRLGPSAALQDRLKQTSLRETYETEKPSYSKSYLDELRNSTPSTPQAVSTPLDEDEQRILDIEAKFGASKPSPLRNTNIITVPSASEIAEKKARRARLALTEDPSNTQAQSEDFISLDAYDSDGEFKPQRLQVGTYLHAPEKSKETSIALEREDEDIAEGFEQFVEDNADAVRGRYKTSSLYLDRKSRKAHVLQERERMKELIENAEASEPSQEGSGSGSESDSSERHHAYESAQTHYGLDGLSSHASHKIRERRPRQPRETTPIVKLSVGLSRLREQVERIQEEKGRIERRLGEVKREKGKVAERKRVVQEGLEGLGREVESLQERDRKGGDANGDGDGDGVKERGLESIGMRRDDGSRDEMDVG